MTDDLGEIAAFARLVIDALEAAEVEYLLGGALATAAWGEPRSTQDVDLVINLSPEQIVRLSQELAARGILLPPDLMLDQLLEVRGDIALVAYHSETGLKAELFPLRPGDALRASALARRTRVELEPPLGEIYVHAPEDLILYKLSYFGISRQTKHVRDIGSMLMEQGSSLDYVYINHWVERLRLQSLWTAMRSDARQRGAQVL
jgi:hypothetical protein